MPAAGAGGYPGASNVADRPTGQLGHGPSGPDRQRRGGNKPTSPPAVDGQRPDQTARIAGNNASHDGPPAPPRPLLAAALAALAGAAVGRLVSDPRPWAALAGCGGLLLFALAGDRRVAPPGGRWPRVPPAWWHAFPTWLCLAALTCLAAPLAERSPPVVAQDSGPAGTAPLTGIWRTVSTRTRPGRRELLTRGTLTPPGKHPRVVELAGPPPADGEAVALLPPLRETRPASSHLTAGLNGKDQLPAPHRPLRVGTAQVLRLGPGEGAGSATAQAEPARGGSEGGGRSRGELRRRLLARLDRLPDPLARGLAAALCLGDRSRLPTGLADLFTRTGTRHLLAVSGLHVGLLALFMAFPLRLLRRGRRGRPRQPSTATGRGILGQLPANLPALLRAAMILALIPLTGGAAPVRRAAMVLALVSLAPRLPPGVAGGLGRGAGLGGGADGGGAGLRGGRSLGPGLRRRPDPLSLWSLALLAELLANPLAWDSLSLKLSYGATLGLILGAGPLDRLLARRLPFLGPIAPIGPLADRRSSLWRVPLGLFLRALRGSLAASLAAIGATLPWTWTTFGEWSPVGPVATSLALVPVALLLAGGWLLLLAGDASWLVEPMASAFATVARLLVTSLELWDRLPGTPTPLPPRPAFLLWGAVGGLFCLLRWRVGHWPQERGPTGRLVLAKATALAWAALVLPWARAPAGLEVHALDVGHGTAVLLRAPGEPACLVDAGSRDRPGVAREAVAPLLRRWEVAELDVVLTHGDADHAGALPHLVSRFPARIWGGAPPPRGTLPGSVGRRIDLVSGRRLLPARRPGAHGPTLALVRGGEFAGNEGSRAMEVSWEGRRLLLTGDAEGEGLAAQLRAGLLGGPLDLLLLPHHGSETPYLGRLLAATRPALVWVSASSRPPLAAELERRGQPWAGTHRDGPLTLFLPPLRPAVSSPTAERSRTASKNLCNETSPR